MLKQQKGNIMSTFAINRRNLLVTAISVLAPPSMNAWAATYPPIKAYRNPRCGCCEKWAAQLKQAGFDITMEDDPNLEARRVTAGVPADIAGCHTGFMGDIIIEGHVPAEDIKRFLAEKPNARGLAVPGMPAESPGMENGGQADPFKVLAFKADGTWVEFARHG
jgi:hypothetical protein